VSRRRELVGKEADVVAWYEAGESMRLVAARYGVSRSVVERVLREAGMDRRPVGRRALERVDAQQLATAYEAGATLRMLMAEHGGSDRSIRAAITTQGVAIRPRGPVAHPDSTS
jgi:transposase